MLRALSMVVLVAVAGTTPASDDDNVFRALAARWKKLQEWDGRPVHFVSSESLPYRLSAEPWLRLELLRRGTSDALAEQLLTSLRERNAKPGAIGAFGDDVRAIAELDLRGSPITSAKTLALPGVSGSRRVAVVLYSRHSVFSDPWRAATLALLEKSDAAWTVRWEHEFEESEIGWLPKGTVPPTQAAITPVDAEIFDALLEALAPKKRIFVEKESLRVIGPDEQPPEIAQDLVEPLVDRNLVPLYLGSIGVRRSVSMISREELEEFYVRDNLGSDQVLVTLSLPVRRRNLALVRYRLTYYDDGMLRGAGYAVLLRRGRAWSVTARTGPP